MLEPLTPLEMWQLVAVVIATVFVAGVCMWGIWALWTQAHYDNYQSKHVRRNLFKTPR